MNDISKHLLPDEKVVWQGMPDPSVLFTKADIFLVPFSLLWGGGVIYAVGMAIMNGSEFEGSLFGVAFLAVFLIFGLYMMIGRFFYKSARKKKTTYAVTNKRILIVTSMFGEHLESTYLNSLPSINKSVRSNGVGTLVFGTSNNIAGMYANTGMEFFSNFQGGMPPSFYDIKDAESVFNTVNTLRNI